MEKSQQKDPIVHTKIIPEYFTPTQEQIYTIARRMLPEVKAFFANEENQKEFENWQKKKGATL